MDNASSAGNMIRERRRHLLISLRGGASSPDLAVLFAFVTKSSSRVNYWYVSIYTSRHRGRDADVMYRNYYVTPTL